MNKHSVPIQEEECINVEDVNLQESQFASAGVAQGLEADVDSM